MAEINAKDVMTLRKQTGSGMMDCKKALTETGGDMEAAVEYLRKKGIAKAAKKADREARQGGVFAKVDGSRGAIIELNCETDFVARTDDFATLANEILDKALADEAVSDEFIAAAVAKLGENIVLAQTVKYDAGGGNVFAYVHAGNRVGTLIQGANLTEDAGKDLAMQVTAQNATYVRREEVPQDQIDKEKEIYAELCKKEGKPEQAWPKIIEGRLNKWLGEQCLLEQEHWREAKQKVADLLPKGATVEKFARLELPQ